MCETEENTECTYKTITGKRTQLCFDELNLSHRFKDMPSSYVRDQTAGVTLSRLKNFRTNVMRPAIVPIERKAPDVDLKTIGQSIIERSQQKTSACKWSDRKTNMENSALSSSSPRTIASSDNTSFSTTHHSMVGLYGDFIHNQHVFSC
jgi:hypothetical protein